MVLNVTQWGQKTIHRNIDIINNESLSKQAWAYLDVQRSRSLEHWIYTILVSIPPKNLMNQNRLTQIV